MTSLKNEVERIYQACSSFTKPSMLQSCECCHTEEEKSVLLNTPLRNLSSQDLWNFTSSSFNTIGSIEDFLYFTPRILELAYIAPHECIDLGLLGHKLYQTNYWQQNDSLHKAIDDSLLANFKNVLEDDNTDGWIISDWLCLIGNATPNIKPFLDILDLSAGFKDYYDHDHAHATKGKLSDSFWTNNHDNQNKIISWLLSDETNVKYWSFYTNEPN